MTTPRSSSRFLPFALALCGVHLLSCFAAPETCHVCYEAVPDGSIGAASGGEGGPPVGGTGGELVGMAGSPGSGGTAASGATGGAGRSGGGAGGATATGGSSSGGVGASGTGGAGAGTSGGMTGAGGSGGMGGLGMTGTGGGGGRPSGSGGATGGKGMASGGTGGGSGGNGSGGAGGRGGTGAGGTGAIDPDLVLWYKFDESSGTTAADSAMFGGTARDGTLTNASTGTASFSTTAKVGSHSVALMGTSSSVGGYVSAPNLSAVAPAALTIACWVYMTADRTWQRVFDFGQAPTSGSSPASYMFLTTHQGSHSPGSVRFAITTNGNFNEETIEMSTPAVPSLNAWHHFAVTLGSGSNYTGTLYIDRAVAGTNTAMTRHWSDLGVTDWTNFGRSIFTDDPFFAGMLDDCRVYRRALSAAEITALP